MKRYLTILRQQKHPVRFLIARLLFATRLSHLFITNCGDFRIRFHHSNLALQLWMNPLFRQDELRFFYDYLRPTDTAVDVGANIGDTSIASSLRCQQVIAFEAHPRIFRYLNENLRLNARHNVRAVNCAVGSEPGTLTFSDDWRDDMNCVGGNQLTVNANTLDQLCEGLGRINLLKIDVEGFELFVVKGAKQVLDRTDCVYFEVCSEHFRRFDYTTKQLLDALYAHGFLIYRITQYGHLVAIQPDFDTDHYENLVAVRDIQQFVERTKWVVAE